MPKLVPAMIHPKSKPNAQNCSSPPSFYFGHSTDCLHSLHKKDNLPNLASCAKRGRFFRGAQNPFFEKFEAVCLEKPIYYHNEHCNMLANGEGRSAFARSDFDHKSLICKPLITPRCTEPEVFKEPPPKDIKKNEGFGYTFHTAHLA